MRLRECKSQLPSKHYSYIFLKISSFAFGRPYSLLSLMEKKLVEERGWLTNKEFMDAVAIGKLTPGPLMIMVAFMGYKIGGVWGALLGTLGLFFPSFITVLIVTRFYLKFKESAFLQSMFNGINIAVVGLLLGVSVFLIKSSILDTYSIVITVLSFIIVAFSKKIDPIFVMIGAGIVGLLLYG